MENFYNLELIDSLYQQFLDDPSKLEPSWRYFFEGWEFGRQNAPVQGGQDICEARVVHMIEAFRKYGHQLASFNPIAAHPPIVPNELGLSALGFKESDLAQTFPTCGFLSEKNVPLSKLIDALKKTYCRKIGIEYMDLDFPQLEKWIQAKIEPYFEPKFTREERKAFFHELNRAELFETFMHTRYVGQKRFSLEGGETLIPIMAEIIEKAGTLGVSDVVIAMAHRGRLNALANILGKSYSHIFHEFEDHYSPNEAEGVGDVKYHKGFVGTFQTREKLEVTVTMSANPSHLESVNPISEGMAKAMHIIKQKSANQVLPILIHGDAAVAGQGVVYETMQLGKLRGYGTGGTIHIVINNQIGFTTLPKDSRSTRYCTDIAKTFSAPVFHVDAEDPDDCIYSAILAVEIRQKFGCDVFIDLNCYRKWGHNEGDEPSFTQPLEYKIIRSKKTIREIYLHDLLEKELITSEEAHAMEEQFKQDLSKALTAAKVPTEELLPAKPIPKDIHEPKTAVPVETLRTLAYELAQTPPAFEEHPKIRKIMQERARSFDQPKDKHTVDWATAEMLAYATLLMDGVHVRLSGQDSRRGTFSHRHGTLFDQTKDGKYFPLSHLKEAKALFDIYDSPLSELAVLGFEFGYSLIARDALVIWEAQYGDFADGAQVVFDQYIAASEQKWGISSSLTLFLPHGQEGQGPEHSSARIERYLELAVDGNIRVANVTTPAQLFHLLRRQAMNEVKKPLILFTPKVLLRHPLVVSAPIEFEAGFRRILDDPTRPSDVHTLIFCSGRFYYDLFKERQKLGKEQEFALVRIELLHPFDFGTLRAILEKYKGARKVVWAQEEPANMGAYPHLRPVFMEELKKMGGLSLAYVGREANSATAAGSYQLHVRQHQSIMEQAFR